MARCAVETCGRWCPDLLVNRGLGARVDDEWFCSRACIERMARQRLAGTAPAAPGLPAMPRVRLGALLVAQGACDAATLARALEAQRHSRLRIGEQLRALGATDGATVLRALATQFNARCLPAFDATSVRHAPGGLSPDAVRALGLAPISDPVEGRVRVACPAPVPRRAVGAFRQLTGWTPELYLVSDEDWAAILQHYGADAREAAPAPLPEFVRTTSLSDAAARIAAAAARGRRTTVTEARWDEYAWVRVQGAGMIEDVCLALPGGEVPATEEAPWPAATTSR